MLRRAGAWRLPEPDLGKAGGTFQGNGRPSLIVPERVFPSRGIL